jgi:hypothetical protein
MAAALAFSAITIASADNGVDVSVEPTATLTAKVEVTATVNATCPNGWYTMVDNVSVEQAVGKEVAHGSGYIPGVQCTGVTQTIPVQILADSTGPHFKNGTAIVSANLFACGYTGTYICASASVSTPVKLK